MSTYTQIIYQIVFSTKYRKKTLVKPSRQKVFAYMLGILKNKKCHLYYQRGGGSCAYPDPFTPYCLSGLTCEGNKNFKPFLY